jgi:CBS domain containing-hemolysin-like protein
VLALVDLASALGLFSIVALVAANAYFVASEFSLVAVRRSQLRLWQAEGRRGAGAAARAIGRLDDAIAATQLGITLASIGLGFLGEPVLAGLLEPALAGFGAASGSAAHGIAIAVAFGFITFLHVVAGELAPKAIALDRPGPVALWCAGPLLLFSRLTRPAIWLMNGCGNALVRLFGVKPAGEAGRVHSAEELRLLVREASESGQIRADTGRMLGNVFALSRTRVQDVMVPRLRVVSVPRHASRDELLDLICEEGFTRFPVCDGSIDRVIGVLHAKDVFHLMARTRAVVLEDAIRPVFELPPDLPVLAALARFRRKRQHLALVRAADGPVLGIVTLEDVLEEIVGEIEDEHDAPAPS